MRITNKNQTYLYLKNLEEIQNRRFQENLRLSTGKHILNISDEPSRFVKVKQISNLILKNEQYKSNMDEALSELRVTNDYLHNFGDMILDIRNLAIESTATGNSANMFTLSKFVKGLLEDSIKLANKDYNGRFLFSGTKTTPESLDKTDPSQNDFPIELIEGTPDAENPSGLSVIFKGNNKARIINKDPHSVEQINVLAEEVFGNGGVGIFQDVIKLYNIMAYNKDGIPRKLGDKLDSEDIKIIDKAQRRLAEIYDEVSNITSQNGSRIIRLETISGQISEENVRLKELRSLDEDTDVAHSTIKLLQEETALKYSLQVGANLLPRSLFDFLGR